MGFGHNPRTQPEDIDLTTLDEFRTQPEDIDALRNPSFTGDFYSEAVNVCRGWFLQFFEAQLAEPDAYNPKDYYSLEEALSLPMPTSMGDLYCEQDDITRGLSMGMGMPMTPLPVDDFMPMTPGSEGLPMGMGMPMDDFMLKGADFYGMPDVVRSVSMPPEDAVGLLSPPLLAPLPRGKVVAQDYGPVKKWHVFPSHSKKFVTTPYVVRVVKTYLKAKGYGVFLDLDNLTKINMTQLKTEIAQSHIFILFLDQDTLNSQWCQLEIAAAIEYGIPIHVVINIDHFSIPELIALWRAKQPNITRKLFGADSYQAIPYSVTHEVLHDSALAKIEERILMSFE